MDINFWGFSQTASHEDPKKTCPTSAPSAPSSGVSGSPSIGGSSAPMDLRSPSRGRSKKDDKVGKFHGIFSDIPWKNQGYHWVLEYLDCCCNENIKYVVKPKPLDHQTSHSVNCQSEPNVNLCNACVPGWIEGQATNTWGRT